ncbi:DNA repair protein RadC [Vibrio cholerae LMA3984-4]|nr:DNA repair protein RadC [Vibrio cholerae LMA3984-4]
MPPVSTQERLKEALNVNAAAVIFAHNHPSGDPSLHKPIGVLLSA